MAGSVVIVESPAKAKTINKYLGQDFTVLASFGHVRDLPPKDGSVRPEEDFEMDWELGDRSKRHVDEIARAVKGASRVFLATDPDREGEAIAWHVHELLKEKRLAGKAEIRRITFNEITKSAVLDAIGKPRDVDQELVQAYLARRALDYLVGFNLSPVLWRKLPGSKSAGRVQSVALRLICEREAEIEAFKPQEYWTIEAEFKTHDGSTFTARLTQLDGKRLEKFSLGDKAAAEAALARIRPMLFKVGRVERKEVKRNPYAPFTTSTLQQEASRKLGFGAVKTMRTAQKLYEGVDIGGETVGLITYMRTDGVSLSQEAIDGSRRLIDQTWGNNYVPEKPRIYKTAAKNAQEAHEAIRPTDLFKRPDQLSRYLDKDELRLYELIWKRTVASQMASTIMDQVTVDIMSKGAEAVFRATGSIIRFDGFLKVYQEDKDDDGEDEENRRLPPMKDGDDLTRGALKSDQHFTQPPPRYTEASLVKKMEELGIGRPSTYASTLQVLQERNYVRLEKRRFEPEDRGRLVTSFLENFFNRYVQYDFTAALEEKLDDISGGRIFWKDVLREFWKHFHAAIDETKDLTITQVLNALDEALGPHFFPDRFDAEGQKIDVRVCPTCGSGRLSLKLGKTGAFIGCSNYPDCRYTRPLAVAGEDAEADADRDLGVDPETNQNVVMKRGPYGVYVQLGEAATKAEKPKRVSLPRGLNPQDVDLTIALALLSLPRSLGTHPSSGQEIQAGIGRFGPYLKHGDAYKNIPPDDDVLTIGLNRAVVLLGDGPVKKAVAGRELGNHPKDGKPISIGSGRFGPYVKHNKLFASITKAYNADTLTLEQAVELLAAKAAKDSIKKGAAPEAEAEEKPKKVPAKKAAAPKAAAAKKPAAKKATAAAKKPALKKAKV
ncbi:DNA topoisomerase I [Niveispirillum lacus]|uniref:DNA topoisomerase 1 n=1 Tax=Niveispirillum lacus TaxID=1981099 RepID=A0A255YWV3_9PROT|nr:type I DNA topoisomerase [Niveispirillum lacus]OYQ33717.1 DNA topoisomerase I [Niveispirillum lacus]